MPTLFCTTCGAPWEPGSRFCGECGAPEPVVPPGPRVPAEDTVVLRTDDTTSVRLPVAADPARSGAPRTHRAWAIGGVVLALVVALGTGGVVLWRATSGTGSDKAHGASVRLARSGLTFSAGLDSIAEPTKEWTLTASAATPGGNGFVSVNQSDSEEPQVDPLVVGDVVVTSVYSDDATEILGVDAGTGRVLWRIPASGGNGPTCAGLDGSLLACFVSDDTLEVIDAVSGAVRATTHDAKDEYNLTAGDDSVYTTRTTGGGSFSVTRRKISDLAAVWTRTYPWVDSSEFDGSYLTYGAGRLYVSLYPSAWLLDAISGDVLVKGDGDGPGNTRGHFDTAGFVISDNDDGTLDVDQVRTTVVGIDGAFVTEATGYDWGGVQHGRLGIGTALYDTTTGRQLWNRPDLEGYSFSWTADRRQIVASSPAGNGDGAVLDPATGETEWSGSNTSDEAITASALIVVAPGRRLLRGYRPRTSRSPRRTARQARWHGRGRSAGRAATAATYAVDAVTDSAVVVAQGGALNGITGFPRAHGGPGANAGDAASSGASADPSAGSTSYMTACGSEPVFTPKEAADANGGVTITFEVHAVCSTGQWLNSTAEAVTVTGNGSTGSTRPDYASGSFDFSLTPYWVPGSGDTPATVVLTFPYGTTFATAAQIEDAISNKVILVECVKEPGASTPPVPADPSYGSDGSVPASAEGPAEGTDPEAAALAALKRIAAADQDTVAAWDGNWLPQLASNKDGSVNYVNVRYDYRLILAEHLRLRAQYPEVRLVWSGDWRSFRFPDYFVTVSGTLSSRWAAGRPLVRPARPQLPLLLREAVEPHGVLGQGEPLGAGPPGPVSRLSPRRSS